MGEPDDDGEFGRLHQSRVVTGRVGVHDVGAAGVEHGTEALLDVGHVRHAAGEDDDVDVADKLFHRRAEKVIDGPGGLLGVPGGPPCGGDGLLGPVHLRLEHGGELLGGVADLGVGEVLRRLGQR